MKRLAMPLSLAFILTACGTGDDLSVEEPVEEPLAGSADESGAADEGKIIVSLEQTAEPTARNQAAESVREMEEFTSGAFGEPTDELAEELAIGEIEAQAAQEAVMDVYGNFEEAGVFYIGSRFPESGESGVWIGIENPDERVNELAAILQEQVDAGKILAKPIHIFNSAYSQADLNEVTNEVAQNMNELVQAHPSAPKASFSVSADVKTGKVQVGHNFLTEEQQQELIGMFPDQEIVIEQSGRMVPLPGEATVAYPDPATVPELSDKGDYLIDVQDDRFLAVSAQAQDFSGNGGQEEFYSAVWYDFTEAAEQLEVGQRVNVESTGALLESYPAQGTAVFVEVLPAYQPAGADLTETEVIRQALQSVKEGGPAEVLAVQSVSYDAGQDAWTVVFQRGEEEVSETVHDE